ncbi:dihydrofolate reductase, partial [Sphingobium sp.]|uniref:dihydrofolate reductase n=1 Tax=Sphingobium sp. TaxID=1912891 RepID=UPI0035C72B00
MPPWFPLKLDGPLPNRTNIVVTSQKDYDAPGAIVVDSLKLALTMAADIAG